MKRILSTFLLALFATWSLAQTVFDSDGLSFVTLSEEYATCRLQGFTEPTITTELTIPDHVTYAGKTYAVTEIADAAFYQHSWLQTVNLPNTLRKIGKNAFQSCDLNAVELPDGIMEIGTYAFDSQSSPHFTSVTVRSIDWQPTAADAGYNRTIDFSAFSNNPNLTEVTIPSSIKRIDGYAFAYDCALAEIHFPSGLKSIGFFAFYNAVSSPNEALTTLNLPDGILEIGSNAFNECRALETINIVPVDTDDDDTADYSCAIETGAFRGCSSLTTATIPSRIKRIDQYAFERTPKLAEIHFPSGLKSIGAYAFCNDVSSPNEALTTLNLPDGIMEIGLSAFMYCKALATINVVPGDDADDADGIVYSRGIGASAFYNCIALTEVTIPRYIRRIGSDAFRNTPSLRSITFTPGLRSIGDSAFESRPNGNEALTTLNLPDGIMEIGSNAFMYCKALATINVVPGDDADDADGIVYSRGIGTSAFVGCSALTEVTIPRYVKHISSNAFVNTPNLRSITFPPGLKSIGSYAFYCINGNQALTTLNLPAGIQEIGNYAFQHFEALTTVNIVPSDADDDAYDALYSDCLGNSAFYYCYNLQKITLPSTLKSIGANAFALCYALPAIEIPPTVNYIGDVAFQHCESLQSITIPEGVSSLNQQTFGGCTSLTEVQLPSTLKYIYRYAFKDCTALKSIRLPEGLKKINPYAFAETGLEDVYAPYVTPLPLYDNTFDPKNKLHVPVGCRDAFRAADEWKDFEAILEDPQWVAISKPTIIISDGMMTFSSDCPTATYHVSIEGHGRTTADEVDMPEDGLLSVYATAPGYITSETATRALSNIFPSIGDLNGDGEVDIQDINILVNMALER